MRHSSARCQISMYITLVNFTRPRDLLFLPSSQLITCRCSKTRETMYTFSLAIRKTEKRGCSPFFLLAYVLAYSHILLTLIIINSHMYCIRNVTFFSPTNQLRLHPTFLVQNLFHDLALENSRQHIVPPSLSSAPPLHSQ